MKAASKYTEHSPYSCFNSKRDKMIRNKNRIVYLETLVEGHFWDAFVGVSLPRPVLVQS